MPRPGITLTLGTSHEQQGRRAAIVTDSVLCNQQYDPATCYQIATGKASRTVVLQASGQGIKGNQWLSLHFLDLPGRIKRSDSSTLPIIFGFPALESVSPFSS
jgi:hypothetical protein